MAPIVAQQQRTNAANSQPRVLVVDDEPALLELVDDVVGGHLRCRMIAAGSLAEAKKILATQPIELMVADVNLPDGKGTALLKTLREHQPDAGAILITGQPSVDHAISALRQGAFDFLPKPFTADQLLDRVRWALARQSALAKKEKRLNRLRDAVKRLNEARRLVSKKVDLLCNDLISAYGELSKQLDGVRTQEAFRKTLAQSKDLEQMLCHAMDWLLRQMGYTNIAVWLASDDSEFQLGAYMKYTIQGQPALTDAMKGGLVPLVTAQDLVHLSADEALKKLSPAELQHLSGQAILGANCTYLGEPLAAVILFRDAKTGFTEADAAVLQAVAPIFATGLATIVRAGNVENAADDDEDGRDERDEPADADDETGAVDEESKPQPKKPKKPNKKDDADWWKRGEPPPF